jgi:hypothetical protein
MKYALFVNPIGRPVPALAASLALAILAPLPVSASEPSEYNWSGSLARGATIEIKNPSGDVFVQRAEGNQVEIRALRSAANGNADNIEIRTVRSGNGLLVCTEAPYAAVAPVDCSPGPLGVQSAQPGYRLDELVRVPAGVNVIVRAGEGKVVIENASGPVQASTIDGDIHVSIDNAGAAPMLLRTTNGSIAIDAPANAKLLVKAEAPGGVRSSFPKADGPAPAGIAMIDAIAGNGSVEVTARS